MFGLGPLYLVLVLNRFNRKDAKEKRTIKHVFYKYNGTCYYSTTLILHLAGKRSY